MTTYTASQVADRALQRASIVAEDDVSTAAQNSWAQTIWTSLFDEMIAQGIRFAAGSSSVLPSEYYISCSELVACHLKGEVGLLNDGDVIQASNVFKDQIRSINWQQPTPAPVTPEYF